MINFILDILFPKQCLNCNAWGLYICKSCSNLIPTNINQRCIICQHPSKFGFTHQSCKTKDCPDRLITIFTYKNKLVTKIISTAKLSLIWELFIELSGLAVDRLCLENKERKEVVQSKLHDFVLCPIPITNKTRRFRGFNQSQVIARVFSANFNLVIDQILIKPDSTKQQKLLNRIERQKNLQGSFALASTQGIPKRVLLIDDITTTGSTFIEATKILKNFGVAEVWCLALAQD